MLVGQSASLCWCGLLYTSGTMAVTTVPVIGAQCSPLVSLFGDKLRQCASFAKLFLPPFPRLKNSTLEVIGNLVWSLGCTFSSMLMFALLCG